MSALKKQLEVLAPILDIDIEDREFLKAILKEKDDSNFEYKPYLSLLEELSTMDDIHHVMSLPGNFSTGSFSGRRNLINQYLFQKLFKIIRTENHIDKTAYILNDNNSIILNIDNQQYDLGESKTSFNPKEHEIHQLKPFIKRTGEVMESYLNSGVLYIGYPKSDFDRKFSKFEYIILYVKYGQENILKKISNIVWQPLFFKHESGIIKQGEFNGITYTQSNDSLDIEWVDHRSIWFFIFILSLIFFVGISINSYMKNPDFQGIYYFIIPLIIVVCSLLFSIISHINRKRSIFINEHELGMDKGKINIPWEYKKIRIARTDILKVFVGKGRTVEDGSFYKVNITQHPGKNIIITDDLSHEKAHFIKDLIDDFITKKE